MFFIGICDDEESFRIDIKQKCETYCKEIGADCACLLFESPEQLLEYDGEKMLLLFLDIEMPKINGVELLRIPEVIEKVWRIVFSTSHEEFKIDTISIKTLGFEKKPVSYEIITRYIEIAIKESKQNIKVLVKTLDGEEYLATEDIVYAEAERNYSFVAVGKRKILVEESLKEIENRLNVTDIVRCHKSYLVNLSKVREIRGNSVITTEGDAVPIGRAYKKKLTEERKRYLVNLAIERMRS